MYICIEWYLMMVLGFWIELLTGFVWRSEVAHCVYVVGSTKLPASWRASNKKPNGISLEHTLTIRVHSLAFGTMETDLPYTYSLVNAAFCSASAKSVNVNNKNSQHFHFVHSKSPSFSRRLNCERDRRPGYTATSIPSSHTPTFSTFLLSMSQSFAMYLNNIYISLVLISQFISLCSIFERETKRLNEREKKFPYSLQQHLSVSCDVGDYCVLHVP